MRTQASLFGNEMILNTSSTPSPRDRYPRRVLAVLVCLFLLQGFLILSGFESYSLLEEIGVTVAAEVPFRLPKPHGGTTKPINAASVTHTSETTNSFVNQEKTANGSRTQIPPKMCSDIFSIGKTRSSMKPMEKRIVSHLRRVKYSRKSRPFLRHESYKVLGDMMPATYNSSTTSGNETKVNFNKVWRMEQLDGLFPHLSCRLRQYSTTMLKQCLVNRRSRGKSNKLLFVGDSTVRQHVEVLLDVFRHLDFEIVTYKGDILSLEKFLSLRDTKLRSRYKRYFVARSQKMPDFEIEFSWTQIFDIVTLGVVHSGLGKSKEEATPMGRNKKNRNLKDTHSFSTKKTSVKNKETSASSTHTLAVRKSSMSESTESTEMAKILVPQPQLESHPGDGNDNSTSPERVNTTMHSMTSEESNVTRTVPDNIDDIDTNVDPIEMKPLKKLQQLLTLPSTEVPDMVVLGSGIWGLNNFDLILKVLDEIAVRQVAQLRSLLLHLRQVTHLVWVMPMPVDDHRFPSMNQTRYRSNMQSRNMEWVANAQVQLMAQGITVWDSFQPLAIAANNDCTQVQKRGLVDLPTHPELSLLTSWLCKDYIHSSNEVYVVAVHMLVNQLCNEFMPHGGYCCEE